jgi:hypothetical protein
MLAAAVVMGMAALAMLGIDTRQQSRFSPL